MAAEDAEDAAWDASLGPADVFVLGAYFVLLAAISWTVSRHQSKINAEKDASATDNYFLAERSVQWWAVGASLFASNIGSEHFIGLAGSAASEGIAVGWYEVGAIPVVLLLGHFFLPTYLNAAVQTTPDYLERRYSRFCRTVIVVVSLFVYIFSKVSATLFAGQIILVEVLHVDKMFAVVLLISFTAMYTILGGLEAVIYTEALQTSVLFVGGFMVLAYSLHEVGGNFGSLESRLDLSTNVEDDFLHFFRTASDEDYPWTGFIFGFYVVAPWYWGVDQVIVQRTLAAKNIAHGQLGCTMAACLKFLPFLMMVVPGLCGRVLVEERLGSEKAVSFDFDTIYPWIVLNVVPRNARGIIIAAMLSSLMSALASVFNSAATLFALNVWKVAYPSASDRRLVTIGRLSIVALAVFSLLWLQVMPYLGSSLFLITQKPPAYVAPPILSLYVWGMLSRTPSRRAGQWALVFGITLGSIRFVLEVLEDVAEENLFGAFTHVNFLHFASMSFAACSLLLFALSYSLAEPSMYATMGTNMPAPTREARLDDSLFFRLGLFYELMSRRGAADDGLDPIQLGAVDSGSGDTGADAAQRRDYHERLFELTKLGSMDTDLADEVDLGELALRDVAPPMSPGGSGGHLPLPSSTTAVADVNLQGLQRVGSSSTSSLDDTTATPFHPDPETLMPAPASARPMRMLILGLGALVLSVWTAQVVHFF